MDIVSLSKTADEIFKSDKPGDWLSELKGRASGVMSHYRGKIDFRFASGRQSPEIGMLGNDKGYFLSMDVPKRYQFQSEYNSLSQELKYFGYKLLKMMESVDPGAISNLMTMVLEKKKSLEDRTMQLLGSVNTVLKSIISLTYELKELDRNVSFYDLSKSKENDKKEAAELALKRIFVDNVDARKGGASLGSMSRAPTQGQGGAGFIDLVAVFYSVKSLKDISSLQRNEQYKNILKNRFIEYEEWKKLNESDLRNRRELLLQYLKSQVAAYNMYTEWAAQYLTILKRINLKGTKSAGAYTSATKVPDIFESAMFTISLMGFKEVYLGDYSVEYQKMYGNKGPELPVSASLKSASGPAISKGPSEEKRSYIYKRLKKYGPKVIAAIDVELGFKEKQIFPNEGPQNPGGMVQYEGTLDLVLKPYCFTLDEWFLFRKAAEANIKNTVFSGVDAVSTTSLKVIQKDLDKYLKEAESKEKKEAKKESNYALIDIYQSFKDDLLGINKALSLAGGTPSRGRKFDPELYEIQVNHKLYGRSSMGSGTGLGLFIANSDASTIYEEFKRRVKLLNPLSKWDVF